MFLFSTLLAQLLGIKNTWFPGLGKALAVIASGTQVASCANPEGFSNSLVNS